MFRLPCSSREVVDHWDQPTTPKYSEFRLGRLSCDWNQIPSQFILRDNASSVTFHPCGTIVAFGLHQGTIEFWNLEFASKISEIVLQSPFPVRYLKFLQNDMLLAETHNTVQLLNIADISSPKIQPPNLIRTYNNITNANSIALCHDGTGFFSFGVDASIRFWEFSKTSTQREAVYNFRKQHLPIMCGSVSEDDKTVIYAFGNGKVFTLAVDVENSEPEQIYSITIPIESQKATDSTRGMTIPSMAFFPTDWKKLVVGFWHDMFQVIDVMQKVVLRTVFQPEKGIVGFFWSPDNTLMGTVSNHTTYHVWNCETWELVKSYQQDFHTPACAISPGNLIVAGATCGSLCSFDELLIEPIQPQYSYYEELETTRSVELEGNIISFSFCPAKSLAAFLLESKTAVVLDCDTQEITKQFSLNMKPLSCELSPDGTLLAITSYRNLHLWDVRSGTQMSIGKLPLESVCCSFSPDGQKILCMRNDTVLMAKTANLAQEPPEAIFTTTKDTINWVSFSPDGQKILLMQHYHVSIFPADSMKEPLMQFKATDCVGSAWSRDSERVAVGQSKTVHILNLKTLQVENVKLSDLDSREEIASLDFTLNGTELVVGATGGSCVIAHVGTGLILQKFNTFVDTPFMELDYRYDDKNRTIVGAVFKWNKVKFLKPHPEVSSVASVLTADSRPVQPIVFHTTLVDLYHGRYNTPKVLELLEKAANRDGIVLDWNHPVKWRHPLGSYNGASFLKAAITSKARPVVIAYVKYVCSQAPGSELHDLTQLVPTLLQEFSDVGIELLESTKLSCNIHTESRTCTTRGYELQNSLITLKHPTKISKEVELVGTSSFGPKRDVPCLQFNIPFHLGADQSFLQQVVRSPAIPSTVWNSFTLKCLLTYKWNAYGFFYYMIQVLAYLVYLALFCIITLPEYPYGESYPISSSWDIGRLILEILLFALSLAYCGLEFYQAKKHSLNHYLKSPFNTVDVVSLALVMGVLIMRWSGNESAAYVSAVASVLVWFKLIILTRGFPATGVFVRMLVAIIKSITSFLSILLLMIIAFAHGFYILNAINESLSEYNTIGHSLFAQYRMLLGDFDVGEMLSSNSASHTLGIIFFCTFTFVVSIILLNVLIALLSNSYEQVQQNAEAEWLAELAEILLDIEENFLIKKKTEIEYFPHKIGFLTPAAAYQPPIRETSREKGAELNSSEKMMKELLVMISNLSTEVNGLKEQISTRDSVVKL